MTLNDEEFYELQERYWNRRYEHVECEEEYCYTWCDTECSHRHDEYWLSFDDFYDKEIERKRLATKRRTHECQTNR
jgi:hypothetical protein